jgi:hypothetical protein
MVEFDMPNMGCVYMYFAHIWCFRICGAPYSWQALPTCPPCAVHWVTPTDGRGGLGCLHHEQILYSYICMDVVGWWAKIPQRSIVLRHHFGH